jgi:hypothetical protein
MANTICHARECLSSEVGTVISNLVNRRIYMSENAKSQLLEILKDLGCPESLAKFQPCRVSGGCYQSTVAVIFPDGREVIGSGEGRQKTDADIAAAQDALDRLCQSYADLIINWDSLRLEAQAGDALIKLGVYLSADLTRASEASQRLQNMESNFHLAQVFDLWKSRNDPDLVIWGNCLSEIRKATLVEALLWRRYKLQINTTEAFAPLPSLLKTLS